MRAVFQPESITRKMSEITSTALLWGFDALEIRAVGGADDRVPHVSERLIRTSCQETDLRVAAVDPEYFGGPAEERATWMNELATLPEVVRLAGRIGCRGVIIGSLDGEAANHDEDGSSVQALERIVADAGRLARRSGLQMHVRAGSPERLPFVADVIGSAGNPFVKPMPEIVLDPSGGPPVVPAEATGAGYVRMLYCGPRSISLEEADRLKELFGDVASRLGQAGFDGDVCLEFVTRPEPAAGLRISTAFVSALRK